MTDTATAPEKLTSAAVRAAIQRYFGDGGERYSVLFEVRNGTAWAANRSVDSVVMSLWPSLGLELWGMEIKVSRSDWLREIKDPAKASEVFSYFDRWFLVAPTEIVKPDEIPEPWGWYAPQGGTLRRMKDGAKNAAPRTVDRNFLAALMRRMSKSDDALIDAAVEAALKERAKDEDRRALEKASWANRDIKSAADRMKKIEEALGDDLSLLDTDEFVRAVKLVKAAGITRTWSCVADLRDRATAAAKEISDALSELGVQDAKPRRRQLT